MHIWYDINPSISLTIILAMWPLINGYFARECDELELKGCTQCTTNEKEPKNADFWKLVFQSHVWANLRSHTRGHAKFIPCKFKQFHSRRKKCGGTVYMNENNFTWWYRLASLSGWFHLFKNVIQQKFSIASFVNSKSEICLNRKLRPNLSTIVMY